MSVRKRQKMISLCDESFKHADSMRNFSAFVRKKTIEDKNQDAPEDFRLFTNKRILVIALTRLQNMGREYNSMLEGEYTLSQAQEIQEAHDALLKIINRL